MARTTRSEAGRGRGKIRPSPSNATNKGGSKNGPRNSVRDSAPGPPSSPAQDDEHHHNSENNNDSCGSSDVFSFSQEEKKIHAPGGVRLTEDRSRRKRTMQKRDAALSVNTDLAISTRKTSTTPKTTNVKSQLATKTPKLSSDSIEEKEASVVGKLKNDKKEITHGHEFYALGATTPMVTLTDGEYVVRVVPRSIQKENGEGHSIIPSLSVEPMKDDISEQDARDILLGGAIFLDVDGPYLAVKDTRTKILGKTEQRGRTKKRTKQVAAVPSRDFDHFDIFLPRKMTEGNEHGVMEQLPSRRMKVLRNGNRIEIRVYGEEENSSAERTVVAAFVFEYRSHIRNLENDLAPRITEGPESPSAKQASNDTVFFTAPEEEDDEEPPGKPPQASCSSDNNTTPLRGNRQPADFAEEETPTQVFHIHDYDKEKVNAGAFEEVVEMAISSTDDEDAVIVPETEEQNAAGGDDKDDDSEATTQEIYSAPTQLMELPTAGTTKPPTTEKGGGDSLLLAKVSSDSGSAQCNIETNPTKRGDGNELCGAADDDEDLDETEAPPLSLALLELQGSKDGYKADVLLSKENRCESFSSCDVSDNGSDMENKGSRQTHVKKKTPLQTRKSGRLKRQGSLEPEEGSETEEEPEKTTNTKGKPSRGESSLPPPKCVIVSKNCEASRKKNDSVASNKKSPRDSKDRSKKPESRNDGGGNASSAEPKALVRSFVKSESNASSADNSSSRTNCPNENPTPTPKKNKGQNPAQPCTPIPNRSEKDSTPITDSQKHAARVIMSMKTETKAAAEDISNEPVLTSCFNRENISTDVGSDSNTPKTRTRKRARSSSLSSTQSRDTDSDKKKRQSPASDQAIRVIITGVQATPRLKKMVDAIGALLIDRVEDASSATHVIAGDGKIPLRRTPKLMICLCRTPNILNVKWLIQSSKKGLALDCHDYLLLDDKGAEKSYSFSMRDTLLNGEAARQEKGGLLVGWYVHFCKGVAGNKAPPADELKLIVQAGGGKNLNSLSIKSTKDLDPKKIMLISSDPPTPSQKSGKDATRLLESGAKFRTTSWLFGCVIRQSLAFDDDGDAEGAPNSKSSSSGKKRKASPLCGRSKKSSRRAR